MGGTAIEPRFAERAAGLLDRGDVPAALSLLLSGMNVYPSYATATFLLGQCYERLGKAQEAAQRYAEVRHLIPGLAGITAPEGQAGSAESGVDFMLRQLPHVKLTPVTDSAAGDDAVTGPTGEVKVYGEGDVPDVSVPIVSVTLAEIYAGQKKYREAVDAYKRLAQQRPAEAGRYRERLAELERLLQGVDKLGEA